MAESIWCQECGGKNDASAKFCSNCGTEIILPKDEKRVCSSCGHENNHHVSYCASCGSKLSRRAHNKSDLAATGEEQRQKGKSNPQKTPDKSFNPIYVGAIIVGLFVGYLFIDGSRDSSSNSSETFNPSIEQKTDNIELENKVYEVASKFVCACGSCGEEPLESCSCQTAQQERQYIQEALQQGQSVDKVITAINMNYGWIRDEYRSTYGDGKLSLDAKRSLNQDILTGIESVDKGIEEIASFADRMKIISHFACPCGQCDDDLKECECDHPNGAQEVKQFIDEKINRGIYSVDKIIEFVDHKYAI